MSDPPIIVKKVRGGGHGHHGGSWKVAYADFMTSMLALFIVLWCIAQSQKVKTAIAEYFKDPSASPQEIAQKIEEMEKKQKPPPPKPSPPEPPPDMNLRALAMRLMIALKGMRTDEGKRMTVNVDFTRQGLRITLQDRDKAPFFDVGSAVPQRHTSRVLRLIGREVSRVRNPVIIEGYTDSRQYKGETYGNWDLSTGRANAARRLLCSGGMDPHRVVEVRGYADTRLVHPKRPLDPENRRVSILLRYLQPRSQPEPPLPSPSDTPAASPNTVTPAPSPAPASPGPSASPSGK